MGDIFNLDNKFFSDTWKGRRLCMLKPAVDDLLYTACVRHLCGICIKSDHISTSMYRTGCSGWNCDNSTLLCS